MLMNNMLCVCLLNEYNYVGEGMHCLAVSITEATTEKGCQVTEWWEFYIFLLVLVFFSLDSVVVIHFSIIIFTP